MFVAPSVPAIPTTAISGTTDVLITWVAPAQGSTPITGYSVAIRHSDNVTYTAYASCTGTGVTCTIAISILKAAPYNLVAGSSVYAKVLATSLIGSSAYSNGGNGAVFAAPSVPAAPTTTNPSSTTVAVAWAAPAQGSTPITGYSVAIRQNDGVTYTAYSGCTGTAITCTIANSVLQTAPYHLPDEASVYAKVLATSLIGSSAYSAAGLGAILPRIPNVPAAPTTTNPSSTTVGVAWVAPFDGGSPITGYSV